MASYLAPVLVLLAVLMITSCKEDPQKGAQKPDSTDARSRPSTTSAKSDLTLDELSPEQAHEQLLARAKANGIEEKLRKRVDFANRIIATEGINREFFATATGMGIAGPTSRAVGGHPLTPAEVVYLQELEASHATVDARLAKYSDIQLIRKSLEHTEQTIDGNPPIDVPKAEASGPATPLSCVALLAQKFELAPPVNGRRAFKNPITYQKKRNLCSTVLHAGDSVAGFGTAFLVRRNRICTAGHNFDDVPPENCLVIFNYQFENGHTPVDVDERDVFTITKAKWVSNAGIEDWGVAELDRDADPIGQPMRYALPVLDQDRSQPAAASKVYVVGHPEGLPLSKSMPGPVLRVDGLMFISPLTTYWGNSGSPIFGDDGTVMGVLDGYSASHARQYYTPTPDGCCIPMDYKQNSTDGELCMRMSELIPRIDGPLNPVPQE